VFAIAFFLFPGDRQARPWLPGRMIPRRTSVLEKINLSNGAVLLCEPVAGAEVVAAGLWFLHGSRDEGPDEQGFSHFLEHMVFKGTSRRTARDIAIDIDRVGGVLNAATEKEVTSIYASVPPGALRGRARRHLRHRLRRHPAGG
jgi:predicted Zn-dependent peptidase